MKMLPPDYTGHLRLVRTPDVEGDDNRGFRADLIEAYVDDEPAGYALTLFIPRDRFETWYPNGIYDYLRLHSGISLPHDPADPAAAEALQRSRIRVSVDPTDPDRVAKIMAGLKERYATGMESFMAFNVDRPKMDYIRVYTEGEKDFKVFPRDKPGFLRRNRMTDFQGLGIGQVLYREMARWHAEQGRPLHSSSLIEPSAVAAWQHMANNLPGAVSLESRPVLTARSSGPMYVMDGTSIGPWAPQWAVSAALVRQDGSVEDLLSSPTPMLGR